ncbi:hypothetical protein HG431_000620 [Candidatus Saccharibacteria bacterium]|jgi:hypothetical protein|nr:hypothetical protein [Candidatus Saccharibacteria bacterium]
MPKSDTEQNERLARLEVFNEKVVEPSLTQILEKLDGLVLKREFEEYKKSTDDSLKKLTELNNKLNSNFLIKVIVLSENKVLNFFAGTIFTLFIVATGLSAMQMAQQFLRQPNVIKEVINVKEDK